MPNPFKKYGRAYHQRGEWIAVGVGFAAKLATELSSGDNENLVLVGSIGSGKSTALAQCADRIGGAGVVLPYSLDGIEHDRVLALHELVLTDLIRELGSKAFDKAARDLRLLESSILDKSLRSDQMFALVTRLASLSLKDNNKRINVLVDECQIPAEKLEGGQGATATAEWFTRLKVLAEALRAGGGRMIITITPSPWSEAPPYVRARFVPLHTRPAVPSS
jgi:hypothetical protein